MIKTIQMFGKRLEKYEIPRQKRNYLVSLVVPCVKAATKQNVRIDCACHRLNTALDDAW